MSLFDVIKSYDRDKEPTALTQEKLDSFIQELSEMSYTEPMSFPEWVKTCFPNHYKKLKEKGML